MSSEPTEPAEPLFEQLRARRNAAPEEVAEHQRGRLSAAMIEACFRRGYPNTTATELARLAGVSTKTLYSRFGGKEGCLIATYELIVRRAAQTVAGSYRMDSKADPDWPLAIHSAFEAFAEEVVGHPKAARLALREVLAAGPSTIAPIEAAERLWMWMIAQSFRRAPPKSVELPAPVLRGLVGGTWFLARTRLLDSDLEAARIHSRTLAEWTLAYRCPEVRALSPLRAPIVVHESNRQPRDERARMMQAALEIAARRGNASLSEGEIVERAEVAPADFAACFVDPRDCFLAALSPLCDAALLAASEAAADADDWPTAIGRAIRALFGHASGNRVFAQNICAELIALGQTGAEMRTLLVQRFAAAFAAGIPSSHRVEPEVAEALSAGIWSIASHQVLAGRLSDLPALAPFATYFALAPILGAELALESIRRDPMLTPGGRRRKRPSLPRCE